MTLSEIQEQVMFQTNNDADDLGDYTPHIDDYINEGYDRIVILWDNTHVPSTDYPRLEDRDDEPNLPEWLHRYLADWATWFIYRNGNPQKQQRGMQFRYSFEECLNKISGMGGKNGLDENGNPKKYKKFINIPR